MYNINIRFICVSIFFYHIFIIGIFKFIIFDSHADYIIIKQYLLVYIETPTLSAPF